MAKSSQSESLIDSEIGSCPKRVIPVTSAGKKSSHLVAAHLAELSLELLVAILEKEGPPGDKATAEESRA